MTVARSGWRRRFRSAWESLIHRAVSAVPLLRRRGCLRELEKRGLPFEQAVFVAQVGQGRAAEVRLFLGAGIPADATDGQGDTGLILASAAGRMSAQ